MKRSGFARLAKNGRPVGFTHRLPSALGDWFRENPTDTAGLRKRRFAPADEITPDYDPRTNVATGGTWDTAATPVTLTLEIVAIDAGVAAGRERQRRLSRVLGEIAEIRRAIVGDDPAQIATYDRKAGLAVAAAAGDTAAVALLAREAGPMGVTNTVLAAEITAKADAWLAATMDLEGARRAFTAAVAAAATVADLDAITDPDFGSVRTALGIAQGA